MSKIAFIGLGIMGGPMAIHLQNAGHQVRGYNRSPGRVRALVEAGGTACSSTAEAVHGADFICLMVPDTPDVEEVLLGEAGVLAHASPGALIIVFSTIRPDVARTLAEKAFARGLRMLDAPVSGGETGARNAALAIMVGGEDEDVAAAQHIFDAVATTVVRVGPSGAGQTVKAANQLIVAGNIAVLAEAVALLQGYGVDLEPALDVLADGLAGSNVLAHKRLNLLERHYEPGFRIQLHNKDLGIVTSAAHDASLVLPMSALLAQLMGSAVANGDGELDHSALLREVLRQNGLEPDNVC